MSLSPEDVRDILGLLDALPVDELDLRTERFRLTLRRGADGEWTQAADGMPAEPIDPRPQAAENRSDAPSRGAGPGTGEPAAGGGTGPGGGAGTAARRGGGAATAGQEAGLADVRSPLPGTFYRAPKPGAPPFIEVGSRVGEDTVVGIIETMKMFNPVPAGMAGRVATIELADSEFAEQDAVLMRIAPGDT